MTSGELQNSFLELKNELVAQFAAQFAAQKEEVAGEVAAQFAAHKEELAVEVAAKVAALVQAPGRGLFLSPTTARGLLETLRGAKKVEVVSGDRLPWTASHSNVTIYARAETTASGAASAATASGAASSAAASGAASVAAASGAASSSAASGTASARRTANLFATLPSTPVILKEKAHLQPWLSKKTNLIKQETFQVTWVDGHKTPSIGTGKPDILHYVKGCSQSVYLLAYLGDLKSQTAHASGDLSDEAIACLIDFFCALAAIQVWRREFIGYLLDGKHVSFFVVRFDFSPNRDDIRAIVSVAAQPPFPPCLFFYLYMLLPTYLL